MKNKLYYFLFAMYIAMVVLILYINGVFTDEMTSSANLIINVGFLAVIGILFMISTVSFIRLNRCTDSLVLMTDSIYKAYDAGNHRLWDEYSRKKNPFRDEILDEAYSRYQKRMKSYQTKKGLSNVCDIEDYINEDILNRVGMIYYNSAITGTLTGLGILGTFIGLSLGLGAFNGDDIYTITDNVGPLLGGMKVAFHTSVYGIFFSLIFAFVHRCIVADSQEKLQEFLDCYRECVEPVVAGNEENIRTMLVYQANMANTLRHISELLTGNALEQTKGVEQMVQSFTSQIENAMATDFARLGRNLEKACDAQTTYAENYKSMEETTKLLVRASLTLQESLENTMERQQVIAQELEAQAKRIGETCDTLDNEISTQLYTLTQLKDL